MEEQKKKDGVILTAIVHFYDGYENDAPPVEALNTLVTNPIFDNVITLFIVFNTFALMAEYEGQSEGEQAVLKIFNYIFTAIFTLEMVLKLLGLGLRPYFYDNFNTFDFVVVWISLVELGMELSGGAAGSGLSALRSFRLMRVFKLMRSWKGLRDLMNKILKSLTNVANAAIVLGIFVFIFALIGMQLFGGKFTQCPNGVEESATKCGEAFGLLYDASRWETPNCFEEVPSANFDTVGWAHVTVFQVLTGENWNDLLVMGLHAAGPIAAVYFMILK